MTVTITFSHDDVVSARWTGVGRPMTAQEINLDLYNIKTAVETLQDNYTLTVSLSTITQPTASTLLFTLTDATTFGPFTMPVATFQDRGDWATSTVYLVNDTFNASDGGLYRVIFDHTSDPSAFDPHANDAAGHDYYAAMIPPRGNTIAAGGAVGMYYRKNSATDYVANWAYITAAEVTFAPSTGSTLTSTDVAAVIEELESRIDTGGSLSGLADVNVTEGSGINGYFLSWDQASGKWVAAASSTNLSGLADVNVTEGSGINGYFLQWDNGTGKWIAAAASSSLSGLTDVNVTEGSGINGYFLKWDNGTSKWIASTSSLSGLADVNVTEGSGINGYFLKWDNGTSRWVASLTGATATALSGLTDVNVTEGSGINGYFLKWDNGTSRWVASLGLLAANNLSDLANAATARTNLGLGTIATKAATSGSSMQKADGSGGLTAATAGTDYGRASVDQNSQSTAYTTVLSDAGKHLYHPSADTNARTFTIDSNANVAYPIGTTISFVNETSNVVTIAITSDTLVLAGTGTTGSRSLAQYGVATALKVGTTRWYISGQGLT